MDLTHLNAAIDGAFAAALGNQQRVAPQPIAPNVTLQTDTYVAPSGPGFRVVCRIRVPEVNFTATRVRNHGPDTASEREWPAEGIEAAAQAHVRRCVAAGEAHVAKAGFTPTLLMALFSRFVEVQQAGQIASKPKLAVLYQWAGSVTAAALTGQMNFPPAPHSFEEAMGE